MLPFQNHLHKGEEFGDEMLAEAHTTKNNLVGFASETVLKPSFQEDFYFCINCDVNSL